MSIDLSSDLTSFLDGLRALLESHTGAKVSLDDVVILTLCDYIAQREFQQQATGAVSVPSVFFDAISERKSQDELIANLKQYYEAIL